MLYSMVKMAFLSLKYNWFLIFSIKCLPDVPNLNGIIILFRLFSISNHHLLKEELLKTYKDIQNSEGCFSKNVWVMPTFWREEDRTRMSKLQKSRRPLPWSGCPDFSNWHQEAWCKGLYILFEWKYFEGHPKILIAYSVETSVEIWAL